uniref:Uncharacterized protein n=1 Tax=Glossina palpalis gambiensis TaxID=67801 RepID=A0A1B0BQ50_9MUSC
MTSLVVCVVIFGDPHLLADDIFFLLSSKSDAWKVLQEIINENLRQLLELSRIVIPIVRYAYGLLGREHVSDYVKQFLGSIYATFSDVAYFLIYTLNLFL